MKLNKWLFILLFVPFFTPATYVVGPIVDTVLNYYRIISAALILSIYIYKKKLSLITLLISAFQLTICFSTIINRGDYWRQFVYSFSVIALCMLIEIFLNYSPVDTFYGIYCYGGIMSFMTAFTMFYYTTGMDQGSYMDIGGSYSYYFIGHDNASFFSIFPVVIYALLYSYTRRSRISYGVLIFAYIIGYSYVYVWSVAAVLGFFVLFLFLLFMNKANSDIFNLNNYLIFITVLFSAVVVFRLHVIFEDFIQQAFRRNVTLSGRTVIWDYASYYIQNSPIYGYGLENAEILIDKFGTNHVHNIVLDVAYQSGVVGLLLFIGILLACSYKLMQVKKHPISKILSIALFIILFVGMADYYNQRYMIFTLYITTYHVDKLIAQSENRLVKKLELSTQSSRYIKGKISKATIRNSY